MELAEPGGARRSPAEVAELGGARRSSAEPGGARRSPAEPCGARRSRWNLAEPGGARRSRRSRGGAPAEPGGAGALARSPRGPREVPARFLRSLREIFVRFPQGPKSSRGLREVLARPPLGPSEVPARLLPGLKLTGEAVICFWTGFSGHRSRSPLREILRGVGRWTLLFFCCRPLADDLRVRPPAQVCGCFLVSRRLAPPFE